MTIPIAVQFRRVCSMTWEGLQLTADDRMGFCDACRRDVFLCSTDAEALHHVKEGHCIAQPTRDALYVGEPMACVD